MPADEQKLRERAYQLWMEDGCKEGQSDQYWFQAEREIRSDRSKTTQPVQTPSQLSSDVPRAPERSAAGAKSQAGQKSPMRSRAAQTAQHLPG
jgi:hypothetical protein